MCHAASHMKESVGLTAAYPCHAGTQPPGKPMRSTWNVGGQITQSKDTWACGTNTWHDTNHQIKVFVFNHLIREIKSLMSQSLHAYPTKKKQSLIVAIVC